MKHIKLLIAALFMTALAACAKEPSLVGTWEMTDSPISLQLKSNGDLILKSSVTSPVEFKWSHEGDKLVWSLPDDPKARTVYIILSLEDTKLTLVSSPQKGPPVTFNRVKDTKD